MVDSDVKASKVKEIISPLAHLKGSLKVLTEEREKNSCLSARQIDLIKCICKDRETWYQEVMEALRHWVRRKQFYSPYLEKFKEALPEEVQATIGKVDPFIIDDMVKESGHSDVTYIRDFLTGFSIADNIYGGRVGEVIEGGQKVHGKPANGDVPELQTLKNRCEEINIRTIQRAQARMPKSRDDWEMAWTAWKKLGKDLEMKRISSPIEVDRIDLGKVLLVDTFGVWEKHGEAMDWKLRLINDFKSNKVNSFTVIQEKVRYDGFEHLQDSAELFHRLSGCRLVMGKADFKSAFKTLPTAEDQKWMTYALVFNPEAGRLQVVQLHSQAFGSIGAVVAWNRTAKLAQMVMQDLFCIPIFAYVDDFFYILPEFVTVDGIKSEEWFTLRQAGLRIWPPRKAFCE